MVQAELFPCGRSPEREFCGVPGRVALAPACQDLPVGGIRLPGGGGRDGVEAGVADVQIEGRGHLVQGNAQ